MGNTFALRGILRRNKPTGSGEPPAHDESQPRKSVDVALIIEAARLVVTTRAASKALLERQLYVTEDVAEKLLGRLEHCEVIAAEIPGKQRRVITTSAELPGVVAEFERRG